MYSSVLQVPRGWELCSSSWRTRWHTQSAFHILKFYSSVFSYVKGMYSFGLMETNFYDRAEKLAKEVRQWLFLEVPPSRESGRGADRAPEGHHLL